MVLRLIGHYDSPFVRRVGVSLHVLGMPFERELLSVFGDAEAMRAFNPLVRVPALVLDDGECLIDSAAILDHLDEIVGPERALLPARGKARRDALQTMALATGIGDKAIAIAYERRKPTDKIDESLDRPLPRPAGGRAGRVGAPLCGRQARTPAVLCNPRSPSRPCWDTCACGNPRWFLPAASRFSRLSRPAPRRIPLSRPVCRAWRRSEDRPPRPRPHFCACKALCRQPKTAP